LVIVLKEPLVLIHGKEVNKNDVVDVGELLHDFTFDAIDHSL
jgi:hypothetical protein